MHRRPTLKMPLSLSSKASIIMSHVRKFPGFNSKEQRRETPSSRWPTSEARYPKIVGEDSQGQSPLFAKLPVEIRLQIYQYFLPYGKTVEVQRKSALSSTRYIFNRYSGSERRAERHDLAWHRHKGDSYEAPSWSKPKGATPNAFLVCRKM